MRPPIKSNTYVVAQRIEESSCPHYVRKHRVGWRYRFDPTPCWTGRGPLGAQPQTRFADARITDERDGTALLNPGHVLAAADADRATFDADRGGAKLEEMSGIAVAVVDVVQSPGPSPRSIRHQTIKNRDADQRAAALRRVRIVLVCPRPAGLRIDRGLGVAIVAHIALYPHCVFRFNQCGSLRRS